MCDEQNEATKGSESATNVLLCGDCKLKAAMDDFGKRLLENQKPLPPEFQKVIDDNYWELLTDA